MANRWGTMETVTDFIFLGSKITAGGDCSHEIKRRLFIGRKAMINLDSILKSRDMTLLTLRTLFIKKHHKENEKTSHKLEEHIYNTYVQQRSLI